MAAREKGHVHYVEQLEKLIPFISSERTFRQDVSELATGVNIFHVDHWVKMDPVKQPIKCHFVGTGYMSHRQTPAFNDHPDHGRIASTGTTKRYGGKV